MKKILFFSIISLLLLSACSQNFKQTPKNNITIYGDYKCPYCKKVEKSIFPKLKKEYIDTGKARYKFINMAFLGKDSIKGSRASYAVKKIEPKAYLNFQYNLFMKQPKNENLWITNTLIDKEINKLHISEKNKKAIKKEYKTKNSESWQKANKDKKIAKKNNIKSAPTVYINNKKIKNPYNIKEYKKQLKD